MPTPTSAPTPAPRVLLLRPAKARPDAARQLAAVVAGLQAGGAEVTQLTPAGPDDQQARTEPAGRRGSPDQPARQGLDLAGRCRSAWETAAHARALGPLDSVVVGQVDLALTGIVTARLTGASRVPVLFHGVDMWTMRRHLRLLLRHDPLLCPVTTSSFGAGALSPTRMGAVIPPGLDHRWREALLTEAARRRPLPPVPTVLTVFPLDEWEAKGLPTLVDALDTLHAPAADEASEGAGGAVGPVRLVIAGAGPAPGALHALIAGREHTDLFEDPSDEELARLYATADLFALCTRTRTRSPVSGESHPTALLEAQLAGCAVIGPAQGGSRDAYQRGVTGWTPADESSPALARVLADLLADRARLARAGRLASDWARAGTDPDDHSQAVFAALLGRQRS
ncbi:glycosyltransferase family 4 protein [Parafrankia sp. EUN1f]|uniref:glycosyltransferase family 4 protein n=1 Tax=Parafrankia sp. EUN1f TaxID=102897 RepID=UPI0001C43982|nr:glycosyltransferase family 4 protein [Parafrankia sp. EUN1f]EFC85870.1 glycosyl transferase group 1 [Parafrankia sp. EUN1f]